MRNLIRLGYNAFKSLFNVMILLGALFVAPLFLAAQFLPVLQGFLDDIAGNYLPHATVTATEKKMRMKAEADAKAMRKAKAKLFRENGLQKRSILKLTNEKRILQSDNTNIRNINKSLLAKIGKTSSEITIKAHDAVKKVNRVSNRGTRIVRRGVTALGVGFIPWAGGAYDVYSLEEDFKDVCDLLRTIDELSELLFVESTLYNHNYCHKRDEYLRQLGVM